MADDHTPGVLLPGQRPSFSSTLTLPNTSHRRLVRSPEFRQSQAPQVIPLRSDRCTRSAIAGTDLAYRTHSAPPAVATNMGFNNYGGGNEGLDGASTLARFVWEVQGGICTVGVGVR
eukprot:1353280-Rhodomonas_salina.1